MNSAPITVTHVNGDGTGPGVGTFEDPFDTIAVASGASTDIVYAYSGTVFSGSHRDPVSGKVINGFGELDISNPDYHVYTSYIIGADGQKKKQFEGVTRRKGSAKADQR